LDIAEQEFLAFEGIDYAHNSQVQEDEYTLRRNQNQCLRFFNLDQQSIQNISTQTHYFKYLDRCYTITVPRDKVNAFLMLPIKARVEEFSEERYWYSSTAQQLTDLLYKPNGPLITAPFDDVRGQLARGYQHVVPNHDQAETYDNVFTPINAVEPLMPDQQIDFDIDLDSVQVYQAQEERQMAA
jgi:hypothetical protein